MINEKTFTKLAEEWEGHCNSRGILSSSSQFDILKCRPAYEIAGMGREILPLLAQRYGKSNNPYFYGQLFPVIVRTIAPECIIPEDIRSNLHKVRDYVIKWIDNNAG